MQRKTILVLFEHLERLFLALYFRDFVEIWGAHFLIRSAQLVRGTRLEQALSRPIICYHRSRGDKRSAAGEVTVGLASHWPSVRDEQDYMTVSGVYVKCTCSRDTSASSALGVLIDTDVKKTFK